MSMQGMCSETCMHSDCATYADVSSCVSNHSYVWGLYAVPLKQSGTQLNANSKVAEAMEISCATVS